MLAPARMPVAAGKNMENTEKNVSPLRKSGVKFSKKILALKKKDKTLSMRVFFIFDLLEFNTLGPRSQLYLKIPLAFCSSVAGMTVPTNTFAMATSKITSRTS